MKNNYNVAVDYEVHVGMPFITLVTSEQTMLVWVWYQQAMLAWAWYKQRSQSMLEEYASVGVVTSAYVQI